MFGSLSDEVEVKVAAEKAWQMYGTLELADIAAKNILESLEVIEGDGGVGTIVKVTFKPGTRYNNRILVPITYIKIYHGWFFVFGCLNSKLIRAVTCQNSKHSLFKTSIFLARVA